MNARRPLFILLVLLSILLLLFFIFRRHSQYQPLASYNELYHPCNEPCRGTWSQLAADYDGNQLRKAAYVIQTGAKIDTALPEIQRLVQTGTWLRKCFDKQLGDPSDGLGSESPWDQYNILLQDSTQKLHCGNFAVMFPFFLESQGILSRYIGITDPQYAHVFNEVYLQKEQKWVFSDIHNNVLVALDEASRPLNFLEVRQRLIAREPVYAITLRNQQLVKIPLDTTMPVVKTHYTPPHRLNYYHHINLEKAYAADQKIKRYFLPVSWYAVYDENGGSNFLFYFRSLLHGAWLLLAIYLLYKSLVND